MKRPHILVTGLCLAAALGAQTTTCHVPRSFAPGHFGCDREFYEFFTWGKKKVQQLYASRVIARKQALITGLGFQVHGTIDAIKVPVPGFKVSRVTVILGVSGRPAGQMDPVFANNWKGPRTVVFSGALSLPPNPHYGNATDDRLAEWLVNLQFSKPFVYQPAKGNLLLEVRNEAGYARRPRDYALNVTYSGNYGRTARYGIPGVNPPSQMGSRALVWLTVPDVQGGMARWLPGGSIDLVINRTPWQVPALLMVGDSRSAWGGTKLPLDLARLGAPGNRLYIAPRVVFPVAMKPVPQPGTGCYWSQIRLPVPNLPSLQERVLYFQALLGFQPWPANPAGVVTTNSVAVGIGARGPDYEMLHGDLAATRGRFWNSSRSGQKIYYGGLPTRFTGVFQ